MNWQSINTAPTDQTVIITDCGFARLVTDNEAVSWCVEKRSYCLCSYDGYLEADSDSGLLVVKPDFWMPLPPLPS